MKHASEIPTNRFGLWPSDGHSLRWCRRRLCDHVALSLRMRQREGRNRQKPDGGAHALLRLQARRPQRCCASWIAARQIWVGGSLARHDGIAALYLLGGHETAVHELNESGLSQLRRSRHPCLRRVEQQFRGVLQGHGSDLGTGPNYRSHRYKRPLRARQLPLGANVRAVENAPLTWPQTCRWQSECAVSQEPSAA